MSYGYGGGGKGGKSKGSSNKSNGGGGKGGKSGSGAGSYFMSYVGKGDKTSKANKANKANPYLAYGNSYSMSYEPTPRIVNSGTKSIGSRGDAPYYKYEFTYDSSVVSEKRKATAITLYVVGTNMNVYDYSDIASDCATGQSMVFVVVNNNPTTGVKLNAQKTADAFNDIVANLTARLGDIITPDPSIFVGGHSAGGGSAIAAMKENENLLDFNPTGCLNTDPWDKNNIPNMKIGVPSLSVGFTIETCSVPPAVAGLAAYNITTVSNRVMMQVVNNKIDSGKRINHCSFTNDGCGLACPNNPAGYWVSQEVGRFFDIFVNGIVEGDKTSKRDYERAVEDEYKSVVNVFFGDEIATV